jgi:hypothetical protein
VRRVQTIFRERHSLLIFMYDAELIWGRDSETGDSLYEGRMSVRVRLEGRWPVIIAGGGGR